MPRTYVTKQGDMWDSVAHLTGITESHTHMLMEANLEYIKYYIFPANIRLVIPHVPSQVQPGLPPWKHKGSERR